MAEDNPVNDSKKFPNAVVESILSKLPVRSLVRLQHLSKSWERIITSPQFTIRRSKSKPQNVFLVWKKRPHTKFFSLMRVENGWFKIDAAIYKFRPSLPLCSCNGVLLLKTLIDDEDEDEDMHLCLLNPSVRSKVTILKQPASEDFGINYGHYYDSRADDYKVVVISRSGCQEEDYSVYSCRKRMWSDKKPLPCGGGMAYENGVFVDGCFYWWDLEEKRLLCFNVREGTSEEAGGPKDLSEMDESFKVKLGEVTGRLCLYCKSGDWVKVRAWVMEKKEEEEESCFGGWRELMDLDGEDPVVDQPPVRNEDRIVCFTDGTLPRSKFYICLEENDFFDQIDCAYEVSGGGKKRLYHNLMPFSETVFAPLRHYKQPN